VRRKEDEKEGGVERTGYRLHLMSMGEGSCFILVLLGCGGMAGCKPTQPSRLFGLV